MKGMIFRRALSIAITSIAMGLSAPLLHAAEDVPLHDNLGDYSRGITTGSELAEAYFNQGMRLAYGFFRAAQAHDPECEVPFVLNQYELLLARFGRWEAVLEQPEWPEKDLRGGFVRFARGLAQLRTGEPEAAEQALASIRTIRAATPEDAVLNPVFRLPQRDLLGIAENILAGEIATAADRYEAAEKHLRRAIALEDGLPYSEPEPWPIPARHVLGAVLLEADQPERAEAVYRASLEVHPDNGWSLKGLAQSLYAQGRENTARDAEQRFAEAWQRADTDLPASRF